MSDAFSRYSGANLLRKPVVLLISLVLTGLIGIAISKSGFPILGALIAIPLALVFFVRIFEKAVIGIYAFLAASFVILGTTRYFATPFPIGTIIDSLLALTIAAYYINNFPKAPSWKLTHNTINLMTLIWLGYCFMQLANPEAQSFGAWVSSIRAVGAYPLVMASVVMLLVKSKKEIRMILYIWGIISLLGTIRGWIQLYIGLDRYEQAWIDNGAYITHLLWGKLRVFSFYSDAGQFGAHQAYTGMIFLIIALQTKNRFDKLMYIFFSIAGFYGMILSGTRGAMAVPLIGFSLYILHRKNFKAMVIGGGMVMAVFVFFKFTTIGNGNYQINRMRTAFNPTEDPSFLVRLENQRRLKSYMVSRPIGGGLGHGGDKAKKYTPNAFLANVATDSYYVMIWVELGIVGLFLILTIQFYALIKGSLIVMFKLRDKELIAIASAFTCGLAGMMLQGYVGQALTQIPTTTTVYIGYGIVFNSLFLDKQIRIEQRLLSRNRKFWSALIGSRSNPKLLTSNN